MRDLKNVNDILDGIGEDAFKVGSGDVKDLNLSMDITEDYDEPLEPLINLDEIPLESVVDDYIEDNNEYEDEEKKPVKEIDYGELTKKVTKVTVVVAVVVLVLIIVSTLTKGTDKVKKVYTQEYPNSKPVLASGESIEGLSEYIIDNLIAEKKVIMYEGGTIPVIMGTTTEGKLGTMIPVDTNTYNSIRDGAILRIRYRIVEINNREYTIESEIMEVL